MATPPTNNNEDLLPPKVDFTAPPPYEENQSSNVSVSCKLPTYEEVQLEKSLHGELPMEYNNNGSNLLTNGGLSFGGGGGVGGSTTFPTTYLTANNARQFGGGFGQASSPVGAVTATTMTSTSASSSSSPPPPPALTFIAIDAADTDNINTVDKCVLGTDIMFITAFIAAFLFNWIGFLMLTCFCHTVACRYGALSGFGLSLAKWTLIVKHSTDLTSHENAWLWWLIMAFGFLISIRALLQYISIKRTWGLLSPDAQERLLFFY